MSGPFCSRLAVEAHGVIAGTGVTGEIYAFLPVNKKRWGRKEFNDSWATADDLDAIRVVRSAGVTVRLYDPPDPTATPAILVYQGPAVSLRAEEALIVLAGQFRRHGWRIDDSAAPRLALCTQGTRDQCCAKWGFSLYRQALALHEQGAFPHAPIQCSHLGGDRFAATGIAFPSGNMYGHLDRLPLTRLRDAEASGQILAGHYRGRVFESPLAQVVRAGLAADGYPVTALSPLDILSPEPRDGVVPVVALGVEFEVTVDRRRYTFFGDCRAAAEDRLSHDTRLAYVSARRAGGATPGPGA